jgi:hypothetical protein
MLCAHTVRRLRPGTFDEFMEAFRPADAAMPQGWVRFHALRGLGDANEVVTFGFFDGTLDELEASQDVSDYAERLDAIAPFVEEVVLNGVYEIAVAWTADAAPA